MIFKNFAPPAKEQRRRVAIQIPAELVGELAKNGTYVVEYSPIPLKARVVSAGFDPKSGTLLLLFEHDSFPKLAEGEQPPIWSTGPEVTKIVPQPVKPEDPEGK